MAHVQLIGITEPKSPDNKVWRFPYAFPIMISQLKKTDHAFEHLDTHLNKLNFPELVSRITSRKRQVYGISAWSHNYLQLKEIASAIRISHKDAVIVVGGIISGNDQVVLERTEVDVVCTSAEGEYVLPEVLDCVDRGMDGLNQVHGISFKDRSSGRIVRTPKRKLMTLKDFQEQDFPAYDYFDEQLHEIKANLDTRTELPVKGFPLLTMRGCPFKCTFCGHMYGNRFLRKKWPRFFEEVELLIDRYGFEGFFSNDTNMFLNPREAQEYCRVYREREATFEIIAELRMTFGDYDMFKLLNEHGVRLANFGLETGSEEMLARMKKGTRIETCEQIVTDCVRAGVMFHGNFIFGTPGENRQTIKDTRRFMMMLERLIRDQTRAFSSQGRMCTSGYGWTMLLPSPTSELYHEAVNEGLITDEEAYLVSLSDERFMQVLKGSTFKISLAQEAGNLNMSEFGSRNALASYIKFSMDWVKFKARFLRPLDAVFHPATTMKLGVRALGHYVRFLGRSLADKLHGRKGYVPRDKRAVASPIPAMRDMTTSGPVCEQGGSITARE